MNSNHDEQQSYAFVGGLKWAGALIAAMWVQIPIAIQTLLLLMALDYASGLLVAYIKQRLCSSRGLRGIAKKILMLLLVGAAHFIAAPLKLGMDLGAAVAIAMAVNEVISIVENCSEAGVPIPSALVDALLKAKQITGRNADAGQVKGLEAEKG